ncbi:Cytochrome P450 [Mycena kentingensis (nom. inval.)]|nr:Cytochrome P450 [Mycena kentingensis (nom. inval.)]
MDSWSSLFPAMDTPDLKTSLLYAAVLGISISFLRLQVRNWFDNSIPAVRNSSRDPFSYYRGVVDALFNGQAIIASEYARNKQGYFRLPGMFRWEYVASGRKNVVEIAGVPEETLSFNHGAADNGEQALQTQWTMGRAMTDDPWHVAAIRGSLTRNLPRIFPEVRDEIVHLQTCSRRLGSKQL